MAEALDLIISMLSSGFSCGQGRNTQWLLESGNDFYLAKPGVMRRQLGPVESHFSSVRNITLDYCTDKRFFLQEKEERLRPFPLALLAIDVKEIVRMRGKREEGPVQALMP